MAVTPRAAFAAALPLAVAALCALLALRYVAPGVDLDAMARGAIGPATWPRVMLLAAGAAAVLLAFVRLFALHPSAASTQAADEYHEARSIGAIALVLGYGIAMPLAGAAWATLAFLAGWLLLGGVRRPVLIGLTSVLGTAGVLYFFVKLSKMPLERGHGVFEQATLALYRLLGIY
jgi:putative tricarboxylic transport membrane protein